MRRMGRMTFNENDRKLLRCGQTVLCTRSAPVDTFGSYTPRRQSACLTEYLCTLPMETIYYVEHIVSAVTSTNRLSRLKRGLDATKSLTK